MNNPLVSIVIPVYNGSNYVREAIDSALAQTYKNVEIIVVNDGSRDNGATEQICLSYGEKIRYFHKENGGVSTALNMGIKNMRGEYFSWLSHDDKYEPDKIERQVESLNQYNDKTLISLCECKCIDSKSKNIESKLSKKRFSSCGVISAEKMFENLLLYGSFCGCALLINKKIFEKCGTFDEKLRFCQDYLMWCKIFLNGFDAAYIRDVCVCSRIHGAQVTNTASNLFYKDSYVVAKEILPLIVRENESKKMLFLFTCRQALNNSDKAYKLCLQYATGKNKFSLQEQLKLRFIKLYGKIRPLIRRLYYRFAKGIITK